MAPRLTRSIPPALAWAAALLAAGCAPTQRCRVTSWLEVEHSRRVAPLPGVGWGEDAGSVRILAPDGTWIETERQSAATCHVTRDAVLLVVLSSGPVREAREAHVYREGRAAPERIPLDTCAHPLVLAERGALLCWACADGGGPAGAGCGAVAFAELDLTGAARWERVVPLPVSAENAACHVEQAYGLSAAGHPVVRVACPARESARWIDAWTRTDVELRPDGFSEVSPGDLPRVRTSLPWLDAACRRWVPAP